MTMEQRTGTAATLAIIAAIGGFVLVFAGNPGWAIIVQMAAGVLGVVGLIMAASPRVKGGILSIVAIVIALFGLAVAILAFIGMLIF